MKPLETLFLAATIAAGTACNSGTTKPGISGDGQEDSLTKTIFETMQNNVDKTKEILVNSPDFDKKNYWKAVLDTLSRDINTVRDSVNSPANTKILSDKEKQDLAEDISWDPEDFDEMRDEKNKDSVFTDALRWLKSDLSQVVCTYTGSQPSDVYPRGDDNWMGDGCGSNVSRFYSLLDKGKFPVNTEQTEVIVPSNLDIFPDERKNNYYILQTSNRDRGVAVSKESLSESNEDAQFLRFLKIANVGDTIEISENTRERWVRYFGNKAEKRKETEFKLFTEDPITAGLRGLYKTYEGASFSYQKVGEKRQFTKISADDATSLRLLLKREGFELRGMY